MDYSLLIDLQTHAVSYYHERNEDKKQDLLIKMIRILDTLAHYQYASDYLRHTLINTLIRVNRTTSGALSGHIGLVYDKILNDARAKFLSFCSAHDADESVYHGLDGIDFTKPTSVYTISANETMYQWCRFTADGELLVGQWFTKKEVEPLQLGISPFFEVTKSSKSKKFEGIGTKALCSFVFPYPKDSFQCTAAGTFDSWSLNKTNNGKKGRTWPWCGGGAIQYFVPLYNDERKKLSQNYKIIRQWG